jgi:hypothetical protein
MNNKYLKYFLVVAVIGVWAAIILRVVKGIGPGPSPDPVSSPVVKNDWRPSIDTFSLYADYPDPFLAAGDTAATDISTKPTLPPQPAPLAANQVQPKEPIGSIIQFNGIITNPQKRSLVGLVTIRGKEFLVKEKDKIGDIRIKKLGKNQVVILYKGDLYTIDK